MGKNELEKKREESFEQFMEIAKQAHNRKLVTQTSCAEGVEYKFMIPHVKKDDKNFDLFLLSAAHDV